jgi:hypothetical protein
MPAYYGYGGFGYIQQIAKVIYKFRIGLPSVGGALIFIPTIPS